MLCIDAAKFRFSLRIACSTFQFSLFGVTNANLGNSELKSAAERVQENIFSASHVRRAGQTDMSTVEYKLVRSMWALIYKRTTSLLLLASSMRDKHNRTNRSPREWNSRLVARINQSNYLLGLRNTFERAVSRDQHPRGLVRRSARRKKGATNHTTTPALSSTTPIPSDPPSSKQNLPAPAHV